MSVHRWGTPTICGSITGHTVAVRIYGKTTDVEIPNISCLFVTGNNLNIPGDMTRRVLVCRIDPKMERPETRDFDFDVEEEAKRDRPALVHAILTILRAYVLAGRPPQHGRPLGSFGQFSRWCETPLCGWACRT
jgi:putative DNA primase/helicase